ncbi:MAG: heme NO-binding domain-containing protein [Planctomycetaceae bacterium]
MQGIIFNLLEEIVTRDLGADTWDDLLDGAGLDGVYTAFVNYPDDQLLSLVSVAAGALDKPESDIIRWFGQNAIPLLAERYANFFTSCENTRAFLLSLNDIIHPEVRKLYPDADVPDFDYEASNPEFLILRYTSSRQICALAEGLIMGAGSYFNEKITLEHGTCVHKGGDTCEFKVTCN